MQLLLARHGNTFESNETPTWVGARNDLPLTKTGIAQAKNLALYIKSNNIKLDAVYCGPLQRTKIYAETILNDLASALHPIIDQRLNEIDYGSWSGLTSVQVQENFGSKELERWEKYSAWPITGDWQGSEQTIITNVAAFSNDLVKKYSSDATILAVSSNGLLRYFLKLMPHEFDTRVKNQDFKIATGRICKLIYQNNLWRLDFWNISP